jgi:SHS family lactate transporter-like MFS transporter
VLLILRMLYGIAMGGEWGVGASLTMETVPVRSRGSVSGLLQAGYPTGYLLASVVYGLLYDSIGWRGMFMIGVLPALLVLYIRRSVPESPSWAETRVTRDSISLGDTLRRHWRLGIYAILLMTAFNFFSHGTQDIYPTFLKVQHGMGPHEVSLIAIVYNLGAILGGIACGMLSERFGRRRVIVVAALLALPALPLWAFSSGPVLLAAGAFLMQVAVQGAWGVVPAHLNELSPEEARGTFPGFVYQTGNLLAAINLTLQTHIAVTNGNDYALAMAWVTGVVAVVIALLIAFGPEKRGVAFGAARLRSELAATPAAGE